MSINEWYFLIDPASTENLNTQLILSFEKLAENIDMEEENGPHFCMQGKESKRPELGAKIIKKSPLIYAESV